MIVSPLETLDLAQGVAPGEFAGTAGRQQQVRSVVRAHQLRWHEQDAFAQSLQGRFLHLRRQAQALEPVDEIVGQQEQMEVRLVGEEVSRRDGTKSVVAFELANDELDASSIVVEAPEVQRLQREIGDEHLVVIAAELEQGQLRSRLL